MIAAIVPAAGRSERMGRPKLILPIGDLTLIEHVVGALKGGGVRRIIVVTPPADAPGAAVLAERAGASGAEALVPSERPIDMRASFELGLDRLRHEALSPSTILLVPADSPGITSGVVARILEAAETSPESILIPTYQGRRGHPIALPWRIACKVTELPLGAGINALVALHAAVVVEIDVDDPGVVDDLDTPEDYRRWASEAEA